MTKGLEMGIFDEIKLAELRKSLLILFFSLLYYSSYSTLYESYAGQSNSVFGVTGCLPGSGTWYSGGVNAVCIGTASGHQLKINAGHTKTHSATCTNINSHSIEVYGTLNLSKTTGGTITTLTIKSGGVVNVTAGSYIVSSTITIEAGGTLNIYGGATLDNTQSSGNSILVYGTLNLGKSDGTSAGTLKRKARLIVYQGGIIYFNHSSSAFSSTMSSNACTIDGTIDVKGNMTSSNYTNFALGLTFVTANTSTGRIRTSNAYIPAADISIVASNNFFGFNSTYGGTVEYYGTSAISLSSLYSRYYYYDLEVNTTGGLTLGSSNNSIAGNLYLKAGKLVLNSKQINIHGTIIYTGTNYIDPGAGGGRVHLQGSTLSSGSPCENYFSSITSNLPSSGGTSIYSQGVLVDVKNPVLKFSTAGGGTAKLAHLKVFREDIVTLNDNVTVETNGEEAYLSVKCGIIKTGSYTLFFNNVASTSDYTPGLEFGLEYHTINYSSPSTVGWISGNLKRRCATGYRYEFPVGRTDVSVYSSDYIKYRHISVENTSISSTSNILVYFNASFTPDICSGTLTNAFDNGVQYTQLHPEGWWKVDPESDPASCNYKVYAYIYGFSSPALVNNRFGLLKRQDAGTTCDQWTNGGGTLNPLGTSGRIHEGSPLEIGFAQRNGLTSYSEFAIGMTNADIPDPCTPPTITSQPSPQTVCEGNPATFTITASGTTPTYQWYESTNGGATWSPILGATSATYNIGATTLLMNGYMYHCAVSGCSTSVLSNDALLTVTNLPAASASALPTSLCSGASTSLTTTEVLGATYSWSGPGGFTSSLQSPSDAPTTSGTYTVTTTLNGCTATSSVGVTVNQPASITSLTPAANPICSSSTTSITAVLGGTAPVIQGWYSGPGQTGTNYGNSNPLTGVGPGTYYCSVTGTCGNAESSVIIGTKGISIYYVNDNSTSGDVFTSVVGSSGNTGLASSSPKRYLSEALTVYASAGCPGDTIKIDAGTYDEHQFDIPYNNLVFLGAGIGKTIFDHNYGGAATDFFMYIHGDNIMLKDMTVKGYINNGTQVPGISGHAFTISGAGGTPGVRFTNMMVELNSSAGASGGNAAITILSNSNVTIDGGGTFCNYAGSSYGGGIDVLGTNTTVHINNTITAYNEKDGAYGGGLLINGDNTTTEVYVSNSRINNNIAIDGGGIRLYQGKLTVRDCVFENNSYYSAGGGVYGGALYVAGGTANVSRSEFKNNTANKGGAVCVYTASSTAATLRLDSCKFSGNTGATAADLYIDQYFSNAISVTCNNTTFSSATIQNIDASLTLTNCGDPTVEGGGTTTKVNTDPPTYSANPSPPTFGGTCGNITLPVELLEFSAEVLKEVVLTTWITTSETNNDYFTVERSQDGLEFIPIAFIDGAGTSNTKISYSYQDENPFIGTSFYRLKQTDFNGKFEVFDPVAVTMNKEKTFTYAVYPNPASKILYFSYENAGEGASIVITDLIGNIVYSQALERSDQYKKILIDLDNYQQGIYFVKVRSDNSSSVKKIIVQ